MSLSATVDGGTPEDDDDGGTSDDDDDGADDDDDGGTSDDDDDGGTSEDDDDGGTPEGDDNMDGEYHTVPLPDDDTLLFAVDTLPFYLSRADYEPNLAHSLLSQKIREGEDDLPWKIRLLHEAIDLYLKVSF